VLRRARNGETRGALLFLRRGRFPYRELIPWGSCSGDLVSRMQQGVFFGFHGKRSCGPSRRRRIPGAREGGKIPGRRSKSYARPPLEPLPIPSPTREHRTFYSLTAGVVALSDDGTDPGELLKKADMALHKAKAEYRGGPGLLEEKPQSGPARGVDSGASSPRRGLAGAALAATTSLFSPPSPGRGRVSRRCSAGTIRNSDGSLPASSFRWQRVRAHLPPR
jgi:hypothetical protein